MFFSLFLLAGGVFLYFVAIVPIYRAVRSSEWDETPCTIVSSRVDASSDDTYGIDIQFSYLFDGVQYTSGRYDFMPDKFHSSGRKGKQRVVDRYPRGKQTVCYVDPRDPSFAVLSRGVPLATLWGLLPGLFVLFGGGGILVALGVIGPLSSRVRRSKWAPQPMQPAAANVDDYDEESVPFSATLRTGPITLKPDASPLLKAVGILVVALIWNGIVSVFLYEVISSHIEGKPQWFLTLFLIPFVLVGLLLAFATIHTALGVFNPRPTLTLGDSAVSLGERVELAWRFSGNTSSLRRLRIYVEGQERAQYRRGTSTYTDQNKFAEIDIVDTTNFMEISSGRKYLDVPADTMHSFKSNHNEIAWALRVKGEVAWWPDVDDTYPLVVLPHET